MRGNSKEAGLHATPQSMGTARVANGQLWEQVGLGAAAAEKRCGVEAEAAGRGTSQSCWLLSSEYFPASQGVQDTPAKLWVPAWHDSHSVWLLLGALPKGQLSQLGDASLL